MLAKLTIIKDDNQVYVDGVARTVDCSKLPSDFHALQWYGDHGEIEYTNAICPTCQGHSRKANEKITDVSPYQSYVDAWEVAATPAAPQTGTAGEVKVLAN